MKKIIYILLILILLGIIILNFLYKEPKVSILCYHNIATNREKNNYPKEIEWTINVENFEEQLKYLSKHNYKTLTLDEFYLWKNGKLKVPFKSVLITFDDGFLSNYHYAFPLLKKYNINATVFVIGKNVENGTNEWNGNLTDYFSLDIINKCKEEYPNIEFASHSYDMHIQSAVDIKTSDEIKKDIESFNKIIDTKYYCYPFGAYNDKMIEQLKKNDFKLAFIFGPTSKEYRKASRKDDQYKIPRLNVSYGMNINKFKLRLLIPF